MAILEERVWWTVSSQINIEENGLLAYLLIHTAPEPDQPLTMPGLLDFLSQSKIVYGLQSDVLSLLVREVHNFINISVLIARGEPAKEGTDAEIQFHFEQGDKIPPKVLDNGNVDFYDKGATCSALVGQLLATKTPCVQGHQGMSVSGVPIFPRVAKDVRLPIGKGVVQNEAGTALYASLQGHIVYLPRDQKLNVFPIYEVNQDVDFSTGNIEFIGTVYIRGNLQPGFKVVAEGDVEISGYADAAFIEAGGNITIRGGIQGRQKGWIRSGGTLKTTFIQNAVVDAAVDCIVQESIMHSRVTAGQRIEVSGKRAVIVGGVICAGREIQTKVLGSPMATPTEVEVGVHPSLRMEFQQVHENLQVLRSHIDKTQKAIMLFESKMQSLQSLPPDKVELYQNLKKTLNHYQLEEVQNEGRKKEIEELLVEIGEAQIIVSELAHSGLKITIGTSVHFIRDDYSNVVFRSENSDIRITHYKE